MSRSNSWSTYLSFEPFKIFASSMCQWCVGVKSGSGDSNSRSWIHFQCVSIKVRRILIPEFLLNVLVVCQHKSREREGVDGSKSAYSCYERRDLGESELVTFTYANRPLHMLVMRKFSVVILRLWCGWMCIILALLPRFRQWKWGEEIPQLVLQFKL